MTGKEEFGMPVQVTPTSTAAEPQDVHRTTCCIVGGGPAGLILALLLARRNIPVTLLEAHDDFDREFRGDTVHPSTMEVLSEIGAGERLLALPHTELRKLIVESPAGPVTLANFGRLKTRFPFIMMLPQSRFLEFVAAEAQRFPTFRLVMGANVQELVKEGQVVRGVRYRAQDGWHEVRAELTVGADGRFSRVRHLAGFELIKSAPPMDVLWFRLPRNPDEPSGGLGRTRRGRILALLDRGDHWRVGLVIPKGAYQQLHAAGVEALRRSVTELAPDLADRIATLQDWKQVSLLSVESSYLRRWYRPGLLLIGDAAHVMSPIGGVGINYAIQDAVVAANVLSRPLQAGRVSRRDLAAVERRRKFPTRVIQWIQAQIQRSIMAGASGRDESIQLPPLLRLPAVSDLLARMLVLGVWSVHVKE